MIAEFQVDIKQRLGVFVAEIDVFGTDFDFVFGFGNVHFFNSYGQKKYAEGGREVALCRGARSTFFLARQADRRQET